MPCADTLQSFGGDPAPPAVPTVDLTAHAMPQGEHILRSAYLHAYLAKPAAVLELADRLHQLLADTVEKTPCEPGPTSS
jgi:hypothetical protein